MDPTRILYEVSLSKVQPRAPSDTNQGSALSDKPLSVSQLLSTLVPSLIYAGIFLSIFLLVRRWFPRVYSPRSFVASLRPQERTSELKNGWFDWLPGFWELPDHKILNSNSLDGYLFIRSLKIYVICCMVCCCITWPILFPINASGPGGQKQLSVLTMANAVIESQPKSYYRYFGHAFCAYLVFGFLLYMITRETIFYINLRQAYLVSPLYADRISSRTVLFNSVPRQYLNEEILREMLGDGVVRIWFPKNTKDLEEAVEERDQIALKLENAETKLIKTANAARMKAMQQQNAQADDEIQLRELGRPSGSVAAQWIKPKDRPTHRLKFLIGKKVDTIDWCRAELKRIIPEVEKMQNGFKGDRGKKLNSVFVLFKDLREAQSAFQSLTHHVPLHMAPRYTGMFPEEIIWSNLRIRWWERVIRIILTTGSVVALIIFWSFPVAFVGALSQINNLIKIQPLHWLVFLNDLPSWLGGVVVGLLPSLMLGLLMSVLPMVLRLLAKLGGQVTLSGVEYSVQNSYFAFQVTQVFLVTTLSSGFISAAQQIYEQPTAIVGILANNLPKASNFYLSYITLQGLGVVSNTLLSMVSLILFISLSKLLDNTPRKMFKRWTVLSTQQLGTVYPIYTNLFVIAISYSCIAPLVPFFAGIGLFLFYLAYRYNFMYVWGVDYDTKGLMYPRALQQMFVGIYLAELCLAGLFAIGLGTSAGALGPLVLMIILIVFTVLYHISLWNAVSPLLQYLPKTLETEERRLLALEEQDDDDIFEKQAGTASSSLGASSDKKKPLPSLPGENDSEIDPRVTRFNRTYTGPATSHPPKKQNPSWFMKWLRPDIYKDYYAMRKTVPRSFTSVQYAEKIEAHAYDHPSVRAETPVIWIPRDEGGVSRQEVVDSGRELKVTDEGAWLDHKNRICWDRERVREAPIWEDKVYY